jgi:SPP1 gp7 family putative phage head morphogenesis protein
MIGAAIQQDPTPSKTTPRNAHPKVKLTMAQRAMAHRSEAAVRMLGAQAVREIRPLWREHVVIPAITRALRHRTDAGPDNMPPSKQPIFDWFVGNQARIVKTQARLQQGTMGLKADAHSPRVRAALIKGQEDARGLIASASADFDKDLDDVLLDPDNFGLRVEEIRDLLLERGNVSESRAELIARDQTYKTNAAITRAGHEDAGFDKFVWSTSLDERVRPEHEALEGEVFSYSSGGDSEEGLPGDPVNCRCVAVPYEGGDQGEGDEEDDDE